MLPRHLVGTRGGGGPYWAAVAVGGGVEATVGAAGCMLLASGLRDYEIKLDRRISAARESLQLFLFGN